MPGCAAAGWEASELTAAENGHPRTVAFTVALTGGIASGKSLLSDEFARQGVTVIDTDNIAHQIVEPGQAALREIESAFGPAIIDSGGKLKRRYLRDQIFSNPGARKKLESILHPRIRQAAARAIAKARSAYCILVIPLLAERGAYPGIDHVLVVDVEPETQIARLMARDGCSREQAQQALASQPSRKQRLSISDDVLDNSGTMEDAHRAAAQLHLKYTCLAKKSKP